MNSLPTPRATLKVLESMITSNIDSAERWDITIEDLLTDLRDAPNDPARDAATLNLARARMEQEGRIAAAARDMQTVAVLRERCGMTQTVLMRVVGAMR